MTTVSTRTGLPLSYSIDDLRLAVGPEVVHHAVTPGAGQALPELVRQHDRHRHQLVGFRARVAEHQPLVAGAAGVHALAMSGDCPWIDDSTAQVSASKPYCEWV